VASTPKKFTSNFYVQFFYSAGSEMAKYWEEGPHYAPFDTKKQALEHIKDVLDQNKDVVKAKTLSKTQANKNE
jgi:hypothetical protein